MRTRRRGLPTHLVPNNEIKMWLFLSINNNGNPNRYRISGVTRGQQSRVYSARHDDRRAVKDILCEAT